MRQSSSKSANRSRATRLRPIGAIGTRAALSYAGEICSTDARYLLAHGRYLHQESITLHRIETVAEPLKAALREEKAALLDQIAFLQVLSPHSLSCPVAYPHLLSS